MNTYELLNELAQRNVQLQAEDDELVIKAPRGALTAALRESLGQQKQDILKLLQAKETSKDEAEKFAIKPDPQNKHLPFPLADIQQAYWIGHMDAIDLGGVSCHYYQEFESSNLELQRLQASFQELVKRHDMLRGIVQPDGQQRILGVEEVGDYLFSILDLRGQDTATVEAEIVALREKMSHEVFKPEQWPLFRVHATLLDGAKIRTHLSFDLLMIDAASLSRMIHDWERLYYHPETADPLDISFRDYVLADIGQKESESYKSALAYWQDRFTTLPPAPELPLSSTGMAPGGEARRTRRKGRLDARRWNQLKAKASQEGLTPSILLTAVFAEVLATWCRDARFTLNLTLRKRLPAHPQITELLGDFTTTVLLEADMQPDTFIGRAKLLQSQFAQDMDHTSVSGVEVLRRLNRGQTGLARASMPIVFTSLLGHSADAPEVLFSPNWLGDLIYGISQTPQVSLDFQAFEEKGDLVWHWDTLEQAFPEGILDHMFAAYGDLLHRLADDGNTWLSPVLDLVPAAQLARHAAANQTAAPVPEQLLHQLFTRQARRTPDKQAVISDAKSLSYAALERRSLALAHELRKCGVKPNTLVAVVMQKGWEQVVAVMAILRAGGAYLPIEASLPQARIQHLLQYGEVELGITQAQLADTIDWPQAVRPLVVDENEPEGKLEPLQDCQTLQDLAYVIFTSGSTGQPKGVMINHLGAANTVIDINNRFQVGAEDRVLALSALNFDLSVYDIFGPLAVGAALVMPQAAENRDPQRWGELIKREQITIWNSVPALMKMMTEFARGQATVTQTLRLILMSGDWIPVNLPEQIRGIAPKAEIISMGGATEASIWSILYPIGKVANSWASIPYGKAMANQSFHVLNSRLKPCPDLVTGELFIGGIGLAMGYWRNAAETAYRFIQHPETGERLYRTGDLGRYLPDGNIELLGRLDSQVKIQGYRVELGEIETTLAEHESVREALVVTFADQQQQKHLAAYVVAENGAAAQADTWKDFLQQRLPRYMVPTVFVCLDALPISANGKIDRDRLPAPEMAKAKPKVANVPLNEIESLLAGIVQKVLDIDTVQVHDKLFDLGCTSIHVVQIHRELSRVLPQDIPVAEMFNHADIRSLAEFVGQQDSKQKQTPIADKSRRAPQVRAQLAQRRKQMGKQRP